MIKLKKKEASTAVAERIPFHDFCEPLRAQIVKEWAIAAGAALLSIAAAIVFNQYALLIIGIGTGAICAFNGYHLYTVGRNNRCEILKLMVTKVASGGYRKQLTKVYLSDRDVPEDQFMLMVEKQRGIIKECKSLLFTVGEEIDIYVDNKTPICEKDGIYQIRNYIPKLSLNIILNKGGKVS